MNTIVGLARGALLVLMLMGAAAPGPVRAADPQPRFTADPVGATLQPPVPAEAVRTASDGVKWLLVADQVLLTAAEPIWHRQIRYQVAQESGLETAGQFSIDFQPAYQRVEIHAIDIQRGTQRLDLRKSARIDVLRREEDLESGLLDGSLTLSVTLPDVRVGDTVAYRYSVIGDNPVFGADYHDVYTARYGVPLGLRRVEVLYPRTLPLRWRAPPDFRQQQREEGALRRQIVEARNLAGVDEEDNTPGTFNPYGRVEMTTARDWAGVVDWARALYPQRFTDRAAVADLVKQLQLDPADPAGSALRATAFVQGEVRYTGVDMGLNSHAPNRPELVLSRRFGDCKDKTTLLIALLSEAGVRAEPVLVNTRTRSAIGQRLPSPLVFNHVIVRAHLRGKDVWIDPTLPRERGQFEERRALPYGLGLPLLAGSKGLVGIPMPRPAEPLVDVEQNVDLKLEKKEVTADFQVATRYRQAFADEARSDFSARGPEKIGKNYLSYMKGWYEGMDAQGDPSARDEGASFHVDERYRLRWDTSVDGGDFSLFLFQVQDWLPKIGAQKRQAPLALSGPLFGRQTLRATVTNNWRIDREQEEVKNEFFRLVRTVRVEGKELVLSADWYRTAEEIPASEVARVRKDVEKARKLLEYNVDLGGDSPLFSRDIRDWLWPLATLPIAAMMLAGLWVVRRRWTFAGMLYRPRAVVAEQMSAGGLGRLGLILAVVTVIVDVVFEVFSRLLDKSPLMLVAGAIGISLGLALRWAVAVGFLKLGFRLTGVRVAYGTMWRTLGLAMAPYLVFVLMAMLSLRMQLQVLGDESAMTATRMPEVGAALAWMVIGILWSCVAWVNAASASAVTSRRRALGALVLAGLGLVILAIPFALLYFLGTLRA